MSAGSPASGGVEGLTRPRIVQLLVAVGVVALMMVAVTAAAAVSAAIPDTGYLTPDPTSVGRIPWWAGSVSRLTNLAWASAATLAVVAGLVAAPPRRRLLLLLGAFLAALTLDDTLLLHDAILPGRGIPSASCSPRTSPVGWRWPCCGGRCAGRPPAWPCPRPRHARGVGRDRRPHRQGVRPRRRRQLLGLLAWGLCAWWAFTDGLAELRAQGRGTRSTDSR